ncbi:predicted protein [Histoplasma capsulatum G186AR]|uniref:Uncharacterized protein n=1 Tax=Ajellomyces capsulatus (strain G186AR / H82 / ATCC MYA-2454 / RMSCC 2432) TaxID=447093 RepID=C0NKS8_AJECG|nr:uncharacterized protein HCBG_03758 [Histoplasma capsulatum G186AR]EEH08469.1 predicted protein [Histoplasma capsulatum G186AR]
MHRQQKDDISRSIYNRYEAVGNPERKEDNSRIRFSWDLETGKWMDKSTWLKMKRHSGSCQVTVDVKAKGNDEVTNYHTMTDVEKRERNGRQVQLTKKDSSAVGTDSDYVKQSHKVIVFDLEESTVDQSSNEEQRGENGDAPVASSDIQRQRKGVDLGAKSVPKQERIVAPTRSPTRRKSSPEASTMLSPELVSRIDPILKPEAMADTTSENRNKESQEPIFAEGLAPGARISLESTPKATESPPGGGSGTSLGAIHDVIYIEQNERESEKALISRAARQDNPIALTLETDIDPERWVKVPRLLEEKGENLNDPAETALAATGGKRTAQGECPATRPKQKWERPPAKGKSRKVIVQTTPVDGSSWSVRD